MKLFPFNWYLRDLQFYCLNILSYCMFLLGGQVDPMYGNDRMLRYESLWEQRQMRAMVIGDPSQWAWSGSFMGYWTGGMKVTGELRDH